MFYSFLGYIVKLHENGQLDDLEEISGSSAGALCSFAYIIARSDIPKLVSSCIHQDLTKLKINLFNFIKKFGFVEKDVSTKLIGEFCFKFTGKHDITFKELYELSNIKLHVAAFSLEKHHVDYFSVDTAPSMSVVDAVSMSLCVPFVFAPVKNYIDGSLSEDIPYGPFIDKDESDVFVIKARKDVIKLPKSLYSYLLNFVDIFYSIRHKCPIPYPSVVLDDTDINILNFAMTPEDRFKMYASGFSYIR